MRKLIMRWLGFTAFAEYVDAEIENEHKYYNDGFIQAELKNAKRYRMHEQKFTDMDNRIARLSSRIADLERRIGEKPS